jgi:hypothetical protein
LLTQLACSYDFLRGKKWACEQLCPAYQYLLDRPIQNPPLVDAHNNMIVVAHDGIGGYVDGEERGKLHDALGDPPATVIVIVAEEVVLSSEESAPRAATDTVIPRSVFNRDEGCAETGHSEIPDFE